MSSNVWERSVDDLWGWSVVNNLVHDWWFLPSWKMFCGLLHRMVTNETQAISLSFPIHDSLKSAIKSVPVAIIHMYQFGMHSTHDQSSQQFSKNKSIFDWARVPPRLSGQFWHQRRWFESLRRRVMDSQVGEWKKLPVGEFLCHRIVENAQEEA